MAPPHRVVDEDYDAGPSAGKPGSLARPRTASVHSIASPGPHMRESRHDAFPPPSSTTRSPPVSTAGQRPSPPYRPGSSLTHPPSPQSARNGTSNRSPPSPFSRGGSSQPRDKTPSLKRGMDEDLPVESKRSRVDVMNPVPSVFPPPPSTDARSSPSIGLGRGRFDPVMDTRMSESPKEPALPPIATLPQPPDSPRAPSGKGGPGEGLQRMESWDDVDHGTAEHHRCAVWSPDDPHHTLTSPESAARLHPMDPAADPPHGMPDGGKADDERSSFEPDNARGSEPARTSTLTLRTEDVSGPLGDGDYVHPLAIARLRLVERTCHHPSRGLRRGALEVGANTRSVGGIAIWRESYSTWTDRGRRPPHSSYYNGPPPLDSAYGSDPVGQIGVHYPREILRIERDYSGGELIQFHPTFPLELEGRVTPVQHQESMNQINEILISAHRLLPSFIHNALGILTLYISTLFIPSHYDKEMRRLRLLIDQLNREIYNPQGLNILWPQRSAFQFLEIEYY
ncbi:coiled-coil vesicle tethering family A protein [Ceratobasidium sp. AG-Ba]|nr:coiled-coil vesicle tethering family A protein [Ceratobasidium sp. AG-Ba]